MGHYRPFYSANSGGGAITLGRGSIGATITYTENWFEDDPNGYNGHGYGQNIYEWLSIASHEVGHLPQIGKEGGLFSYLFEFMKQYAQAGNHNDAPYEKEADKGSDVFDLFNHFVNNNYGSGSIETLFNSNKSQEDKIKAIDNWWGDFQKSQVEKKTEATKNFLNTNIENLEEGEYEFNGSEWVKK